MNFFDPNPMTGGGIDEWIQGLGQDPQFGYTMATDPAGAAAQLAQAGIPPPVNRTMKGDRLDMAMPGQALGFAPNGSALDTIAPGPAQPIPQNPFAVNPFADYASGSPAGQSPESAARGMQQGMPPSLANPSSTLSSPASVVPQNNPLDPTPQQGTEAQASTQTSGPLAKEPGKGMDLGTALKGLQAMQPPPRTQVGTPSAPHRDVRALGHVDPLKFVQLLQAGGGKGGIGPLLAQLLGRQMG